jgi:hypothetical protein
MSAPAAAQLLRAGSATVAGRPANAVIRSPGNFRQLVAEFIAISQHAAHLVRVDVFRNR